MKRLASATKALALKTFNASEQIGAPQWGSEALLIHIRFGPPEGPSRSQPTTTPRCKTSKGGSRQAAPTS